MDIWKEVQCPICLDIIRKTRTVMECLHRFCKDCIEMSLRLGKKECPVCRTHCASRRSLRDDPNFDALILALYPDLDTYEEEELPFEVEKTRSKKSSIAQTFQRQPEVLGKNCSTAKAVDSTTSRFQRNMQARREWSSVPDIVLNHFDGENREENDNDGCKEQYSVDVHEQQDAKNERAMVCPVPRSSPAGHEVPSKVDNNEDKNAEGELRFGCGIGYYSEPRSCAMCIVGANVEAEFYDFKKGRAVEKFERGQIWALYSNFDLFPRLYGCITKVELEPFSVHLTWLEACPEQEQEKWWLEKGIHICCGKFEIGNSKAKYHRENFFSHVVRMGQIATKCLVEILPQVGEIWCIYMNWTSDWTPSRPIGCTCDWTSDWTPSRPICDIGEFAIGEIVERTEESTKISLLTQVNGYIVLFKPDERNGVVEIPTRDRLRFSHRIPSFRLTEENDGKFRGFYELDPVALPEVFLYKYDYCRGLFNLHL